MKAHIMNVSMGLTVLVVSVLAYRPSLAQSPTATPAADEAQREQAVAGDSFVENFRHGYYYNRALRMNREAGQPAAPSSAALQRRVERTLQAGPQYDEVEATRTIVAIRALHRQDMAPVLQSTADRADAAPRVRVFAARSLALLTPKDRFAEQWVGRVAAADFTRWNVTEQGLFITLLPLLDCEATVKHAKVIEAWATRLQGDLEKESSQEASARLGEVGHILNQTQRIRMEAEAAKALEKLSGKEAGPKLVDAFLDAYGDMVQQDRVVQTILRRNLTDQVVAAARAKASQQAAGSPAAAKVYLLLDTLGAPLSDAELETLEKVFPPPPLCD